MADLLSFGLLGPLEVTSDGAALRVSSGRRAAVLAFLLIHADQVISVDRLIDELWDGAASPGSAKTVQVHVSHLRKLLGPGVIMTQGHGYVLHLGECQLDTRRFEALVERARREAAAAAVETLREALALWRGPALADFAYERFAQPEISRLEEVRLSAIEDRVDADLALGRHVELVPELEALTRAHPLRERFRGALMVALYRCGRQADALASYQVARRALMDGLGLAPGVELQQLEQAILRHDPALAAPSRVGQASAEPLAAGRAPDADSSRLADAPGTHLRTFLIADVQGYTRYASEYGDEAGAELAARFEGLMRELVPDLGGELLELRGGEARCVFGSPRQALRAAIGLQRQLRASDDSTTPFPLGVGIGLDAGEAVPTDVGYHGVALNLAARLCGMSGPGQILASETVTRLARRVDGIHLAPERPTRVKGVDETIRPILVVPEEPLPALPPPPWPAPARGRRRLLAASGAAVLLAAGGLFLWRLSQPPPVALLPGNTAGLIDMGTNRLVADVPVGGNPRGVAIGGGSVWVTSQADNTVRQVELGGGSARPYPVGSYPSGVAFGFGSAWVADSGQAQLSRINPTTGVVTPIRVGNGPVGVTTGTGMVWVSNSLDGTVTRVDPDDPTHRRKTFPVSGDPTAIAYGDGAVWVVSGDQGTVLEITPSTGKVAHAFVDPAGPEALAVGDGGVWVANADGSVWRVDDNPNHPDYGNPNILVPVGGQPTSLAVTPGAVWVGSRVTGMLTRIDPTTGEPVSRLRIGSDPAGIAVTGGRVWVAASATARSHRGGTLRILATRNLAGDQFDSIDPATAYHSASWQLLAMTNDGLVTYRHAAGAAGTQLVADLATRIPTPTDEGKTYTFQLRQGVHYSTGGLVRPIDVRASIERLFTARSPNPGYYTGIIGADSCTAKHCDLRRGIAVDNAAGTVTFHLRAPDADFLDKLALPFADVLPAGTPPPPSHGNRRVPATGPYRVASYHPGNGLLLVRNARFRQWSADAQPDGYPTRITIEIRSVPAASSLGQVEHGRADWSFDGVPSNRLAQAQARYPTQFHENPVQATVGLFLNTRVPPFTSLKARQAINYATDRRETLRLAHGPAQITCQILPPVTPGYRPYCPYTIDSGATAGQWTAPNLAKARQLVRASGTKGTRVKIWMWGAFEPWASYFARLLTKLGYPTTFETIGSYAAYYARVQDSDTRAQVGVAAWTADYPTPSAFFQVLLSCSAFKLHDRNSLNWPEWCDPSVDAQMRRAARLQLRHIGAANVLWASVDRAVTNQAPWVPLINLIPPDLVSKRVGNYTSSPYWGVLIDQMWVK